MKCLNCEAEVTRLFPYPDDAEPNVCGACQISLSGTYPGVSGVEYVKSVNPDKPDHDKALRLLLGELQNSKKEKLNNQQAQFIYQTHKRDFEHAQKAQQAVPQRVRDRQHEQIQQMTYDDLNAIEAKKQKAREELNKKQAFFNKLKDAQARAGR